jgi:hypothetical protein
LVGTAWPFIEPASPKAGGGELSAVRGASKTCPAPTGKVGCAKLGVQSNKPDATKPQNLMMCCMQGEWINELTLILMKALSR